MIWRRRRRSRLTNTARRLQGADSLPICSWLVLLSHSLVCFLSFCGCVCFACVVRKQAERDGLRQTISSLEEQNRQLADAARRTRNVRPGQPHNAYVLFPFLCSFSFISFSCLFVPFFVFIFLVVHFFCMWGRSLLRCVRHYSRSAPSIKPTSRAQHLTAKC